MLTNVLFVGRHTAETCAPIKHWALISIGEPDSYDGMPKIPSGWEHVLKLSFHDVSSCKDKDGMDALLTYFGEEDAKTVVEFVRQVAPEVEGILIHCRAGISRSAAIAKWVCGEYRIPFNWKYDLYNLHVYQHLVEAGKALDENGNQQKSPGFFSDEH